MSRFVQSVQSLLCAKFVQIPVTKESSVNKVNNWTEQDHWDINDRDEPYSMLWTRNDRQQTNWSQPVQLFTLFTLDS
jgi:hypothetical protein